jgi:hypothetical protein
LPSPPNSSTYNMQFILLIFSFFFTFSKSKYFLRVMGLFKSNRVVYKPVKDVNLGPDSTEFYLQANVKGS